MLNCATQCLSATNNTCIAYQYNTRDRMCRLSNTTVIDNNSSEDPDTRVYEGIIDICILALSYIKAKTINKLWL